ncbi:MAG: hypothetical protein IJV69_01080 [Kiritimatiellae bacterium]|nr:hypothetical protein [Kiritimatiellia bacterium]
MLRFILQLMTAIALVMAVGCSSYSERITAYRQAYAAGDLQTAGLKIRELLEEDADEDQARDALPVLLEAGSVFRAAGHIRESYACFARAERIYEYWQNLARFSVSREGVSLLTNPATLPYRGGGTDILMLNTYQALNTLQMGDIPGARQSLVRMDNHQKAVVADNAERIAKTREATEKSEHKEQIHSTTESPKAQEVSAKLLDELPDTRGYDLYVNPFSEYLYAFYHLYAGVDDADREMARFRMQRALAMAPENTAIRQDAERLEAGADFPAGVYLFHENGMAPYREEVQFAFPIFAGNTISMVAVALPKLTTDANIAAFAHISGGGQSAQAELVSDVDAIVTQEYKNDYPGILTRAIASATAKAAAAYAANYAAQQSGDGLVQLLTFIGTAAYQIGSNVADTRSWISLPKQIGVSRIDLPADRTVTVSQEGYQLTSVKIPEEGDIWVIHLRTMHRGARPSIQMFRIR